MIEILKKITLFKEIGQSELKKISEHAKTETYKANEYILKKGERYKYVYIIKSGIVKLYNKQGKNKKEETVCIFHNKDTICLSQAISRSKTSLNIKTIQDSEIIKIPIKKLKEMIGDSHNFAKNIISYIANKECYLCDNLCNLALKTTKERLALYLLDEAKRQKKSTFVLPLSQAQLASYISTVREVVSRDLKNLAKAKLIISQNKQIKIIDKEGLTNLVRSNIK